MLQRGLYLNSSKLRPSTASPFFSGHGVYMWCLRWLMCMFTMPQDAGCLSLTDMHRTNTTHSSSSGRKVACIVCLLPVWRDIHFLVKQWTFRPPTDVKLSRSRTDSHTVYLLFLVGPMRLMSHNWLARKQRLYPQSVADISRHSVLSGDRIRQCETSSESRHKDTDQCL